MVKTLSIGDNKGLSRFELHESGETVFADYIRDRNVLSIRYVFSPENLRGSGAAGRLMAGIVEKAREENLKIIPICGYAASWLQKHKEHHDLIA